MITGFHSIFVHNKTMGTNNRGEAPTNNIVWVMHMKSTSEPIVVFTSRIPTEKYFPERAGLHERLGNCRGLFIIIMDVLQADIEKEANFELQQRRWKHTFEAHGIIARRGKTEYMHMHRPRK